MANRLFRQFVQTADTNVVILDGYVNLSNSDSTVLSDTLPMASVARTNTGEYTITLVDSYPALLFVDVMPVLSATNKDFQWYVKQGFDVTVNKTIVVQFNTGTSAADLGAGQGFFLSVVLKNSSLPSGQ